MSKIWMTSDQHFFHKKIIEYANRPFSDVKAMNSKLIDNWNSVVSKDDTVWILGDFSFYCNRDDLVDLVGKLNGNKNIILGNHDRWRPLGYFIGCGFSFASKYPIIFDTVFLLSHRPRTTVEKPFFNIHGHTHIHSTENKRCYNVSVDATEFYPKEFIEIKKNFFEQRRGVSLCKQK